MRVVTPAREFRPPLAAEEHQLVSAAPELTFRELLSRYWPDARPYWRGLTCTVLLSAILPALETARVWLFKIVIDDVLVPHTLERFWRLAATYLLLTAASGVIGSVESYLASWLSGRFTLDLRVRLFSHLQRLSLDFFDSRRLGDILSRLTGDVSAIEGIVLSGLADAVVYTLRIVFFVAALMYLQWMLALAAFVVVPGFWLIARRLARRIRAMSRERSRRSAAVSAVAEESLANIAVVQAYDQQAHEVARLRAQALGSVAAQLSAARSRAVLSPLVDLLEVTGALVVVALGTWALAHGQLTLGGLLVFLAYLGQLYSPVRSLARLGTSLQGALAAGERVAEVLDQQPTIRDRANARRLEHTLERVEFRAVSFRYPSADRDALTDVSFCISRGESVALVGPSGAGKSTIAKLLLRFYDPSGGGIYFNDVDARDLELASLRQQAALLLQDGLVFDASIRDNIAYGMPQASDADIEAAATVADAHDFIRALPNGYATQIGQKGRRLSGGQRQRIAIARALIRDAPLLVLDEPTTGLDPASGDRLMAPLRRLMANRASVIIAHNLQLARTATRIIVLQDGSAVERGTHEELIARGGVYAALYRLHRPEELATLDRPLVSEPSWQSA